MIPGSRAAMFGASAAGTRLVWDDYRRVSTAVGTLSNGDRTVTISGGDSYYTEYATLPTTEKVYFELVFKCNNVYGNIGIAATKYAGFAQDTTAPWLLHRSEHSYWNGSGSGIAVPWSAYSGYQTNPGGSASMVAWTDDTNRTYGFAFDPANGDLWITRDGSNWMGGGDPTNSASAKTVDGIDRQIYLVASTYATGGGTGVFTINSRTALTYSVPSGYTAIGG